MYLAGLALGLAAAPPARAQTRDTFWDFNSLPPGGGVTTGTATPYRGNGSIAAIGGTTHSFTAGHPADRNSADNSGYQTTRYPEQGAARRTAGIQLNLSTVGCPRRVLEFYQRLSNSAANTWVLQYTLDRTGTSTGGTVAWANAATYRVTPAATGTGDTWYFRSFDFSGVAGLAENPLAAFRVVSDFDHAAGTYVAARLGTAYATTGSARFDLIAFSARPPSGWLALPPGAGVTTVLAAADNEFNWYAGPDYQLEWLNNNGSATDLRIKGWQDVSGLKFNLASYRGRTVAAAELHLARADSNLVAGLVAATIAADWAEGTACWRYRALPATEWAFAYSDLSAVTFGNGGSLVAYAFGDGDADITDGDTFRTYVTNGQTWIAMVLEPSLVQALILDQYGLVVTDPRFHLTTSKNPSVFSREAGSATRPRLYLRFATNTDVTAAAPVAGLSAVAGEARGEVVLRFTAPTDAGEGRAFGYHVWYGTGGGFAAATPAERWRIPRPRDPGTPQRLLIESLQPGGNYTFYVQAYDSVGNTSTTASVSFALPAAVPTPALADGGLTVPPATNQAVRTVAGVMRYFAASEVATINPATGNRSEDGYAGVGADDYKKANVVWDAASNAIALRACRNEMVGAQLIVQRLGASLSSINVSVSDLDGPGGAHIAANPNVELFQMHYVTSGSNRYAEAALPLAAPFPTNFAIPDASHNVGGAYQSVYMDVYVPTSTWPGDYTGTVRVTAAELGGSDVRIGLKLRVSAVAIPDAPTFRLDLNGYGNPWDFGPNRNDTCLKYFQVCHRHRAVLNTLPYTWNGSVEADRAPTLSGNGPTRHAASWSTFDAKYGRFFTSDPAASAFGAAAGYHGPGANTPVAHFYTPFHEMWPQAITDTTCGFDASARGPGYWDGLRASGSYGTLFASCPDVWAGFGEGYRQAQRNVMADWLRHAATNGWTRTAFQSYLNHKYTYSGTRALWVLEECEAADDFRAVGCFQQLWREGQAASGVTNVPWQFRIDISERWGQHYGELDNRVNLQVVGSGAADWHWPSKKYRRYLLDADRQEEWTWYSGGSPVAGSGVGNARLFLRKWCQGFNGGTPYWDNFNTSWTTGDEGAPCIVYSGESVPGFGLYAGPIVSRRLKQMRQAQQLVELLNLWAACPGMNRTRARDALSARYGDGTWNHTFDGLDEVQLYRLRADLVAELEAWNARRTAGLAITLR